MVETNRGKGADLDLSMKRSVTGKYYPIAENSTRLSNYLLKSAGNTKA
jgi:hypothetical protein